MNLKNYLKQNKINTIQFAAIIDCAQSYVSMICANKRRPSPGLALKIEKATDGEVTVMELLYPQQETERH